MKNPRPESSVEGWISVADLYAKHIDHATGNYAEHALGLLPINKDMKILDMATGSGALAIRAARRGAEVTAIDFTPPLIKILTERAKKENLDNLEALVMNGQNLDFEDNIFDAAFSVFGLMLFPDRNKGFSELKRVLIPEAKAIVVTWDAPPNNEWFATFQEAVKSALPEMPTPDLPPFLELADKKRLEREMSDAGFENVEVKSWSTNNVWKNRNEAWMALALANPIFAPLMDKIGKDKALRLQAVFDEILKKRFGDNPVKLKATAHFAIGTA